MQCDCAVQSRAYTQVYVVVHTYIQVLYMIYCLNFDTDALQISDCFASRNNDFHDFHCNALLLYKSSKYCTKRLQKLGSEHAAKIIKLVIWVQMSVLWTTNG